jgi:hypothetical protein
MISLKKGEYFFNIDPCTSHPELQQKIPLYMTKKDAQTKAAQVSWAKNAVIKVKVEQCFLFDFGWAIANSFGGVIQVFTIGAEPKIFDSKGICNPSAQNNLILS